MARHHRGRGRNRNTVRLCLSVGAVILVLVLGAIGAHVAETRMAVKVQNAGQQMTNHVTDENVAQVFMNDRWYQKKDVETLLVIGIDDFGAVAGSDSYNNDNQADFMMLFVKDKATGKSDVIHLNRDTMTDITMLGVTGQSAGTRRAQLALAYNYGQGQQDSSRNTADAVSHLLYGVPVDHYITVTMNAVPVMNDWAGGVTLTILDDMTGADSTLVQNSEVKLTGEQALTYIRTRMGLDDSTNLHRMERQRQYARAWLDTAKDQLKDQNAVTQLVMQLGDYHYSDCTAEKLAELANGLGDRLSDKIYEIPGESVKGEQFIEFHADDNGIQQMVLEVFYEAIS